MAKENYHIFSNVISDTLSTAIIALDKSLMILHMNAASENIFGKSRERVFNKSYSELFDKKEIKSLLTFVLANDEPQIMRSCKLRGQHCDTVLVDCIATPYRKDGHLDGVVLEILRIDHQQRIAREEQLLLQQEATQTLVRGLSHEIKNPLGGLRGAAQLLDSELDSAELKEYTNIIISEADRLKNLVDRMLSSHQMTNNQPTNIHEVLERVRKLVRADIPKGVTLDFDYDPSIPDLHADRDHLIQIVFNIVGNALKAVGDSGKILFKTRILRNYTINNKQHRLVLKLEIADDGKGVPEDIRDKLFYPMVSGSAQGTGLGLSIAQTLANRHKGVIEVESQPGETRFVLLLPIPSENQNGESEHG